MVTSLHFVAYYIVFDPRVRLRSKKYLVQNTIYKFILPNNYLYISTCLFIIPQYITIRIKLNYTDI